MHDDDQTNEPDDSGDEDNRPSDADDPTPTGDAEHFPPSAGGKDPDGQFTQRVRHSQVSALVPEDVARGIFATGALVLNGPHEFVVDFLQAMTRPQ